jgi:hypothetical protein
MTNDVVLWERGEGYNYTFVVTLDIAKKSKKTDKKQKPLIFGWALGHLPGLNFRS